MIHHLVVTKPFLNFVPGDMIVDLEKVARILSSEYKKFATKVTVTNTSEG